MSYVHQITLLLCHIAMITTVSEWGTNIYFFLRHLMFILAYVIPSVEEQKQVSLFSCITVNPVKLLLLEQN